MGEVIQRFYDKDGVFIHANCESAEDDVLKEGRIFLTRKQHGIFIEWIEAEKNHSHKTDWTVLDNVTYSRKTNINGERENVVVQTAESAEKRNSNHKFDINFDITDLKSFRRSKPQLGWSYIVFVLRCGTTHPALHFHKGGTRELIDELNKYLIIKKSENDHCLYLVSEHNPEALTRSFDELHLFGDQTGHIVSKFIKHPMTTTLSSFAKFTNSLKEALLVRDTTTEFPSYIIAPTVDEFSSTSLKSVEEAGYEFITQNFKSTLILPKTGAAQARNLREFRASFLYLCVEEQYELELPPRPNVTRSRPLTSQMWSEHMNQEGQVKDVDNLKEIIFRGGVESNIRVEVWKFLLGYYSWDSSYKSRAEQRKKRVDDYFAMKLQWKSVTEEQEKRYSLMRDRKNLIDKDVTRTDRQQDFYRGEDNANLQVLYDILMTYCMYDFDLGYVQGMSDLLAPILVVMENEVDAFWCLAGLMEILHANFELDQEGMKTQLLQLNTLLKFYDPDFYNYLESQDSNNMYFCFRWLLVQFKREFQYEDTMKLWEVLWTSKPCSNFHLLICLAILDTHKNTIIECSFGFTEILKYINDLSCKIELEDMLKKAEGMALQIAACQMKPDSVALILGLPTSQSPSGVRRLSTGSNCSSSSTPERTIKKTASHSSVELKAVGNNHI